MIRTLAALLLLALASDAADARRRYTIMRAKPRAHAMQQPPAETVRVIPIVRWRLWCERIGTLDCPKLAPNLEKSETSQ